MPTITDLIKDHRDKKLSSPSAKLNQVFSYKLDGKKEYDVGNDTKIKIGGEAGADVLLINESNETDAALDTERVFDLPRKEDEDAFEFLKFTPLIDFDQQSAWFRYRLFAKAAASASATTAPVGLSLDANAEASASYYKKHPLVDSDHNEVTIKDALIGNIGNIDIEDTQSLIDGVETAGRLLLQAPDIFKSNAVINGMKIGDAVSLRVAGGLKLGVEVNLTDLLSGAVAGSGVFSGLLSVKYSAGATFTANAAVTDEFILIIAKSKNNRFDVAYRKAESRSLSAGAKIGVKADIDTSDLNKLVDEAFASVAEVTKSAMSKLTDEIDGVIAQGQDQIAQHLGSLSPSSKKALDKLLPKLNEAPFEKLEDIVHKPEEIILKKIEELRDALKASTQKLFDALKTEGKSMLELSVGLEYSRISADRDVLRFNCNQTILNKVRRDLCRMDLSSTLKAIRTSNNNQIKLVSYLREESLEKQRTFSIGLSLFGWNMRNARSTKVRRNILYDLKVQPPAPTPVLRVAYETTRTAKQEYTRLSQEFAVSFGAQSRGNARSPEGPTTDELDYTLGAAVSYGSKRIKKPAELLEYIDTGLVFGALKNISPDYVAEQLFDQLQASIAPNTKVTVNTGISVKGELCRSVIQMIGDQDVDILAQACASAMTWLDDFQIRSNLNLRQEHYSPVFYDYLSDNHQSNGMLRNKLFDAFANYDESLAKFEKFYADGNNRIDYARSPNHMDYFLGVVTKYRRRGPGDGDLGQSRNEHLRIAINKMSRAARTLSDSWATGSSFDIIENRIHKQLLALWGNEFNGRFLGAYLNHIASHLGLGNNSAEFEQVFRINFKNKNNEDDFIDFVSA